MKVEPLPYRPNNGGIDGIILLLWTDNRVQWKDEAKYDRRWQKRCDSCLAPCCLFTMSGYYYDYGKNNGDPADPAMHSFFKNEFVIMDLKNDSYADHVKDGFNVQLDAPELRKLQICPLNILGKCSIYDDRPKICRNWKCAMKLDREWGIN